MKIIVGLGNPGGKYINTRHNVGFIALDKFIQSQIKNEKIKMKNDSLKFKINKKLKSEIYELSEGGQRIILAKPQTFMNRSGDTVKRLIENCKLSRHSTHSVGVEDPRFEESGKIVNLIIIHDDLDIPLGKYKIQLGKGPREHGGVESVEKTLRTKDFWRVRIGVENRDSENRILGEKYVLQDFTKEERKIIDQVILEATDEIKKRLCSGNSKL